MRTSTIMLRNLNQMPKSFQTGSMLRFVARGTNSFLVFAYCECDILKRRSMELVTDSLSACYSLRSVTEKGEKNNGK